MINTIVLKIISIFSFVNISLICYNNTWYNSKTNKVF